MPLQNYQYDKIMREYSKTQSRNRRLLEEHKQEIYFCLVFKELRVTLFWRLY